jgi:Xaa-Pro dipeptidase
MTTHLTQVQNLLNTEGIDVAYFSDFHSISYLTGFESDPIERILALFVFPQNDPFIFAPALEVQAVKATGWQYPVYGYQDSENPFALIAEHIRETTAHTTHWAVEQQQLTLNKANALQTAFPDLKFTADLSPIIERMRLIKTPDEIAKMHAAGRDADLAFQYGFDALRTGITELSVQAELEYKLKMNGVTGMSFDTMVQFGPHAADPHGATNDTKLKGGQMALFDLGTIYDGYVSDATRTVAFNSVSFRQRDIYQLVLKAQREAQAAVKPGITTGSLDKIARDIITEGGFGDFFIHRLGHGLGSSVHESLQIAAGNDVILEPGMTFSIEPGIYIPGDLGIRIEDSVVVTESGSESFTHTSKELLIID